MFISIIFDQKYLEKLVAYFQSCHKILLAQFDVTVASFCFLKLVEVPENFQLCRVSCIIALRVA